jgi:lysophospholipase L1-like esterase
VTLGQRFSLLILIPVLCTIPACAAATGPAGARVYANPQRFESSIKAFERADEKNPPAPDGIVVVGSSSIVKWRPTIQKDLAPLKVIPRGFGGSTMNDALYYVDRIVNKYRPRAVVVYEGDNDIAAGISPQKISDTFTAFVAAIHKKLPETHIYLISIKPSPSRKSLWPKSVEANNLMHATCDADKTLTYVSIVEPMFDAGGKVKSDLFNLDRLHMNAKGYALWRSILRPLLVSNELPQEKVQHAAAKTDHQ